MATVQEPRLWSKNDAFLESQLDRARQQVRSADLLLGLLGFLSLTAGYGLAMILLDRWLELPSQQITPVHRPTAPIRKNQVFRFAILRSLPSGIENRPQDSERIQRDAPTPGIGLSVVEFALIEALYDFNAVEMNSSPPQRGNLSDPQRTNNH